MGVVERDTPDGSLERGFRIGKLAASLAGSYIGYQFQNVLHGGDQGQRRLDYQKKASRQVRRELEQLKGPVMKLGQMLSSQDALISKEVLDELSGLQMHAPPMHPTLARAQFRASFGKAPEEVFREFSDKPFSAASLGQVHRAVTKSGRQVAVKIQYPAIRAALKNDFRLLRAASLGALRGYFSKSMLDELESTISSETDYCREAENLALFRDRLRPLGHVKVPKPLVKYSSDRVLTMTLLDGEHLDDWLASGPTQELRDRLGARLFHLFYYQIHLARALHADPHPGNYLFSGDGEIGLVDFGCVKEVAPQVAESLRVFASSGEELEVGDRQSIADILWGEGSPAEQAARLEIIDASFEFSKLVIPSRPSPVDFGDRVIFERISHLCRVILESKQALPEFLFVCRAELGLYNLLHRMEAKVNTRKVIQEVLKIDRL